MVPRSQQRPMFYSTNQTSSVAISIAKPFPRPDRLLSRDRLIIGQTLIRLIIRPTGQNTKIRLHSTTIIEEMPTESIWSLSRLSSKNRLLWNWLIGKPSLIIPFINLFSSLAGCWLDHSAKKLICEVVHALMGRLHRAERHSDCLHINTLRVRI